MPFRSIACFANRVNRKARRAEPAHDSMDGGGTRPWMVEGRATQEQLPRAGSGTAAERFPPIGIPGAVSMAASCHSAAACRVPLRGTRPTVLLALFVAATPDSHAAEPDQQQANAGMAGVWEPPSGLKQIPIWPSGAPGMTGVSQAAERVRIKKPPDVNVSRTYTQVTDVTTPTATIFPLKGVNIGVSMVVFPGGGFWILAIDLEGTEICDWITAKGMT